MTFRRSVRALMASAAVAAAIALGGCQTEEGVTIPERALKPLSPEMVRTLESKDMPKDSPLLVRLFKEESELEVWKQDTSGRYALLKTYPICRWSGELGPKIREGDRQAPEGFYTINPGQMNPHSSYYLAVNIGFPNEYDRANGRTGNFLMIHGDCSSRGCYAMTDEQIGEIYALAREAFFGGQRSFQVQAYPFRMTPINLARHRSNPNMAFWKMLKVGYDHFEVTRQEPKVDVCEKHYVFDAEPVGGALGRPVPASFKFSSAARCPAYQVSPEVAEAVAVKKQRDETEVAALVQKGTPLAPIKTYTDGGMHPVFAAALHPQVIRDSDGNTRMVIDAPPAPGSIPLTVNPPRAAPSDATGTVVANTNSRSGSSLASASSKPAGQTKVATAKPESGNMFTRLFTSEGDASSGQASAQSDSGALSRWFGIGEEKKAAPPPQQRAAAVPPQKPAPPAKQKPAEANATPAKQPAPPAGQTATAGDSGSGGGLMSNQPMAPGSFENRWATPR